MALGSLVFAAEEDLGLLHFYSDALHMVALAGCWVQL